MALHPAGANGLRADLIDIAAGLAATARDVPLEDGDATRRFAQVLSTVRYDAWVIRWRSSADLRLHDHGDSFGIVQVVGGELVELRAGPNQQSEPRSRTVRPGETIRITPATIHAVSNTASKEALSVHVYSPPLSSMTFYETRDGLLVPSERNLVARNSRPT
jgi:quercetin dioxygenase-like cupin family protein